MGQVPTSGWSGFRLSQRFTVAPPSDGLIEFDFEGDAPSGPVLEVMLPAMATCIAGAPDWLKGVKVYAASGSVVVNDMKVSALARTPGSRPALAAKPKGVLYRQDLVSYDDSFNPIGFCSDPLTGRQPLLCGHKNSVGHVTEMVGHDTETAGHALPKYAPATAS